MTIVQTAKITSKGQITIPNRVRKLLHLQTGASVAFGITRGGVILFPCKFTVESPYTSEEWAKIENLAIAKGKIYKTPKKAKKHIETL